MNCTNKQQESCNVEKLGCKGCYYEEKTADENSLQKLIHQRNLNRQLQALKRMNEKEKNKIIKQSGYDIEEAILIEEEIYLKLLHWKENGNAKN